MESLQRYLVIDCANVGRWATDPKSNPAPFSSWKISAAVNTAKSQGFRPLALCPANFINGAKQSVVADDPAELLELQKLGFLELLPVGTFDDFMIIDRAIELGGFVLTNDGFLDHVHSGKISKIWSESRCISFSITGQRLIKFHRRCLSNATMAQIVNDRKIKRPNSSVSRTDENVLCVRTHPHKKPKTDNNGVKSPQAMYFIDKAPSPIIEEISVNNSNLQLHQKLEAPPGPDPGVKVKPASVVYADLTCNGGIGRSAGNGGTNSRNINHFRPPFTTLFEQAAHGGFVFHCSSSTLDECLRRGLFGAPLAWGASRGSNKLIGLSPGTPILLYDFSSCCLHGVFMAESQVLQRGRPGD